MGSLTLITTMFYMCTTLGQQSNAAEHDAHREEMKAAPWRIPPGRVKTLLQMLCDGFKGTNVTDEMSLNVLDQIISETDLKRLDLHVKGQAS